METLPVHIAGFPNKGRLFFFVDINRHLDFQDPENQSIAVVYDDNPGPRYLKHKHITLPQKPMFWEIDVGQNMKIVDLAQRSLKNGWDISFEDLYIINREEMPSIHQTLITVAANISSGERSEQKIQDLKNKIIENRVISFKPRGYDFTPYISEGLTDPGNCFWDPRYKINFDDIEVLTEHVERTNQAVEWIAQQTDNQFKSQKVSIVDGIPQRHGPDFGHHPTVFLGQPNWVQANEMTDDEALLLQVDGVFADGCIYFFCNRSALERGEFENIRAVYQGS